METFNFQSLGDAGLAELVNYELGSRMNDTLANSNLDVYRQTEKPMLFDQAMGDSGVFW